MKTSVTAIGSKAVALILFLVAIFSGSQSLGQPDRSAAELHGHEATLIADCDSTDGLHRLSPTKTEYRRYNLTATADAGVVGRSVHWSVATETGDVALLSVDWHPVSVPDYLALWVKNPSGHEVKLDVSLTLAGGPEVMLGARDLGLERNWQQLAWPLSMAEKDWSLVTGLTLHLAGLHPGTQYELYLDQIEEYAAPLLPVRVEFSRVDRAVSAGDQLTATLAITPGQTRDSWPAMTGTVERDGFIVARMPLQMPASGPQEGRTVSSTITGLSLPAYLAPGQYEFRIRGRVDAAAATAWPEVAVENVAPAPDIGLRAEAGQVTLVCGDEAVLPLLQEGRPGAALANAETRPLLVLDATSDFHLYMPGETVWQAPGRFDYSELDRRLADLLEVRPDALVMLRVYVGSPPWWDEQYPEDTVRFAGGSRRAPDSVPGRKRTYPSWASDRWREDAAAALQSLVEHVEAGPAGGVVAGYLLCSGEWGNWQYPGATHGLFADYSASQQRAFQEWLRGCYEDLGALRAAWGQPVNPVQTPEAIADGRPILNWSQVPIPDANQRRNIWATDRTAGFPGVLRDPVVSQETIDYDLFAAELVVETIELLAGAVKQAAPDKLCGARYGHLFDQARYRYALQNGGHQAIWRALRCPQLDFFAAPSAGMPGRAGDLAVFGTVHQSLASHGKLLVYEWPTHGEPQPSEPWMRNRVAQALCAGATVTVPAQGMTDSVAEQLACAAQLAATADRSSVAEIAVIVDDISVAYTSCGSDLTGPLLDEQRRALTLLGAPVDVWLLDDVLAGRCPVYKMYVVLNAFYLTAEDRVALREQLSRKRATCVYIYAAGLIEQTIGGRTAKDLTGLSIVRLRDAGPLQVALGEGTATYGTRGNIEPRFVASEGLGGGLGQLVGTAYDGLVAMDTYSGTVVWSSAPNMPAGVLRDLARQAGVHLYATDGSAVYACRQLVALRAAADGPQRLHLPTPSDVYDCFTGELVARNSRQLDLTLQSGDTALLYLQDASAP